MESLSLLNFAKVFFLMQRNEAYTVLNCHQKIAEKLEDLLFGRSSRNLIICMPPRFGKSELCIKIFLAYCLALLPNCNFIVASATLDLARAHVVAIRNAIKSDWFMNCFEYGARLKSAPQSSKIVKSTSRSDFFETIQGGTVKAVGLGGQITGFGAGKKRGFPDTDLFSGCVICDDLLKEQDFLSQTQRDIVYSWFKSTIVKRRNTSKTPIVLIMQRLHDDDIVGRLLKEEPEQWDVLKLQAFDEEKQCSVWESAISTNELLKLKNSEADIDKFMFYANYQQEPKTDLSATIKVHWWRYYDNLIDIQKQIHHRIITMDTAYKVKTYSDESVLELWGFDAEGQNAYLMDLEHGRWEFPELLAKTKEFYRRHNVYINNRKLGDIFVEDKASGTSLAQTLKKEGLPARLWLPKPDEPKDKMSRVLECSRFIASGRVFLPRNVKFANELIQQCAEFTGDNSVHDDMVDGMTMALMLWRNFGAK